MIDRIKRIFDEHNFDFKTFAYQNDELSYLFPEWAPYYRMKYAICKTLNPTSILETGVRYGYSAITFLKAAPHARYLGIDNDTNSFGGSSGAIEYARDILKEYDAEIILADSQQMGEFPGDHWDLIHIDGQQDGDGTFHDLELAIRKATWILVDGYFWSDENLLATSYFMKKYRNFINNVIIIPGYAGDLLIRVNNHPCNKLSLNSEISACFNKNYYTNYSIGADFFKRTKGKKLEPRLSTQFHIAKPKTKTRILDIGCGRGELCFALANSGADVTGIDYSEEAIKLATETFQEEPVSGNLSFICGDAVNYPIQELFDVIIASDLIEHLEQLVLEKFFMRCSSLLKSNGRLILHTAQNRLYYEKYYAKKRKIAQEAGSWIPSNPRTYYEDIIHINEQSPDSLQFTLSSIFPHSLIWVTSDGEGMAGSLGREYSEGEISASRDIFAVASRNPIYQEEILALLSQYPLQREKLAIIITTPLDKIEVKAGNQFSLDLTIQNTHFEKLVSFLPNPVHISYHWRDANGNVIIFDGVRTCISPPLYPQEIRTIETMVAAPSNQGQFILEMTLVQEGCFWFEEACDSLPIQIPVEVL